MTLSVFSAPPSIVLSSSFHSILWFIDPEDAASISGATRGDGAQVHVRSIIFGTFLCRSPVFLLESDGTGVDGYALFSVWVSPCMEVFVLTSTYRVSKYAGDITTCPVRDR